MRVVMLNRLKKIINEILNEDYLELPDMLVEIGVLSYLAQKGILNSNKEKKLRKFIGEATGEISPVIQKWLFAHGLNELAEEIGGNFRDYLSTEEFSDISPEDLLDRVRECVQEDYYKPLVKAINKYLGGSDYFGDVDAEDIEEALKPYIVEEEPEYTVSDDDEEEPPPVSNYFDGDEDTLAIIMNKLKGEQVKRDSFFVKTSNFCSVDSSVILETNLAKLDLPFVT